MYLVDLRNEVRVGSEGVLDGEVVGIVPVEGAFGLVMAVPAAASTVGEGIPDVWHSGVRGIVLDPTEFGAGNEEVAAIAIPQVVEDGGVT